MSNKIIIHIDGGIGKNIVATAAIKTYKELNPDTNIIVTTAWDEVFINNPFVSKVYNFNNMKYFYEDHILNNENNIQIYKHDVYNSTNYILFNQHLIHSFGDLLKINTSVDDLTLSLHDRELNFVKNNIDTSKPIFVIQTNGGMSNIPYSWSRDMPINQAQIIVNAMVEQGYRVYHLRKENQLPLENAEMFTGTVRQLLCLLKISTKRLLIDSFAQHACAAFKLPSTVLWIANNPRQLGYEIHSNIEYESTFRSDYLRSSYLNKYSLNGDILEFPYQEEVRFDISQILSTLI